MKHIKAFESSDPGEGRKDDIKDLKEDIERLIGDRIFELTKGNTREFKSGSFASGVHIALKSILDEIDSPDITYH